MYVDGFVVPVPKAKLDAYKQMATKAAALWREHGALEFKECVADDVPKGEVTSFPRSVQATDAAPMDLKRMFFGGFEVIVDG